MLYLITLDGTLAGIVDTPIDLERAGPGALAALCRDLAIPLHSLAGSPPMALAIRPEMITQWAPSDHKPLPSRRRRRFEPPISVKR